MSGVAAADGQVEVKMRMMCQTGAVACDWHPLIRIGDVPE